MRHARSYLVAGFAALAVGAVAFAQTTVAPLEEAAPVETLPLESVDALAQLADTVPGNAQNGATLAGVCAACHGTDGKSTLPELYPNIGGQSEKYLARQLALFKSGERANAIMQPFASMLSAQDMRDVAAHFATQPASAGIADDTVVAAGPYEGMKFYEIGEQLFRRGDFERAIPACMACHGPTGAGNPGPAYPHVGGQQAWYTARRLEEYRAGTTTERDTGMFDIMAAVAGRLTDEEIGALASYMQGLHKRPDAATLAAIAKMPAPAPAAEAAPAPADGEAAPAEGEAPPADADAVPADAPATDLQQP
ncbi:cytochrome c4 [Luteimonas granuli]|uniref:Cytochrome c4 n=1 Tax=Luteimonas granuli TaxID=1176533 RepID=A0A518N3Q4_9GAMM|nr:c-type cytochrome [Luteimonas granuli]QDW66550.1 cytochrome c4 [Luteimonas granuli]